VDGRQESEKIGSGLTLRLFGSFEALLDGQPMPRLRSRKGEWLLALLALRAGRAVERDWLAGVLWPESTKSQGLALLRRTLTDLRRALGPEAARLCSPTLQTLRLELCSASVDVVAFDEAIAAGDSASLTRAGSLYRGPLLEGCAEEWAFREREAREQAYLRALESLAAEAMERADFSEAEGYLRRIVAVDPLRESAQRALMRALSQGGNEGAALLVYRELREHLRRELNTEPDGETQVLFRQIREAAKSACDGRGAGTGDTSPAALPSSPAEGRRESLPAPLTTMIGREAEVAAVQGFLSRADIRLVTLSGAGGSGKTRLGIEVARGMARAFRDGVFFVSLAPIRDPGLVASPIARALAVPEEPARSPEEALRTFVREKQLLLLLDNFEQVLPAAPLVAELLAAAPGLKVLVTSREALRLRGEQEFPVLPLATPDPRCLPAIPALTQYPAVELFLQRARNVRPDFAVTSANAAAVAEICHRLDGLPLAIELAAARIKLFPPHALLARLERRLQLLTGGARDLPARQQTLRNAIAWSYDLLDEAEKRLFRRLSVFVNGCALESAEAVCNVAGDLQTGILDGVASLVDKHLLRRIEDAGEEPRFGMLETIREFGQECLAQSDEEAAVRRAHADYFLAWTETVEPLCWRREGNRHLDRLECEHDNLRAALAWALEQGAAPEGDEAARMGLRLASAAAGFWRLRGHGNQGRDWLTRLLALPGAAARTRERARALMAAGRMRMEVWEYGKAQALCEEGLAISRELEDRALIADGLRCLGQAHGLQDRHELARALALETLAIRRDLGDREGITDVLNGLGGLAYRMGDLDVARRHLEEAVALGRELGQRSRLFAPLGNLALVARYQEEYDTERRLSLECLEIAREVGAQPLIRIMLGALGSLAYREGDLVAAREYWEEVLANEREYGQRDHLGALLAMANLSRVEGKLPAARTYCEEALAAAREVSPDSSYYPQAFASAWMGLAEVACAEGDLAAARAAYREALRRWPEWEWTPNLPKFGPKGPIAGCVGGLAAVARREGNTVLAARLFGAADSIRKSLDLRLPLPEARDWECEVAALRALMDGEGFASAWADGAAMSLEQACALALN
jgi:predicted ATPase/DNA-binding SARP family transcriptional activator